MIQFENKIVEGKKIGKMFYAQMAVLALDAIPLDGIKLSEMRLRINLMNKLDTKEPFIELALDEINIIKRALDSTNWSIIDQALIDFRDYLDTLKE